MASVKPIAEPVRYPMDTFGCYAMLKEVMPNDDVFVGLIHKWNGLVFSGSFENL